MTHRSASVLLAIGLAALSAVPSAAARRPGVWTQITDNTTSTLSEASLARTTDGVLHVVWRRPSPAHPASTQDLLERSISSGGAVKPVRTVASGWSSLENPALVSTGGQGLDVFVGAIRSLAEKETITNLGWFTSADGGQTWVTQEGDVTKTGAADASDMAAAVGTDGTPFEAWGSSSCLCVHRGTDSGTPNVDFQAGLGHYGYEPGMVLDPATGRLIVAWYSNGTGHTGVYAAAVNQATGARVGSPMRMPGTSRLSDGYFGGRTQIVARHGGGVYTVYEGGYPSHNKVLLWRIGGTHSILLASNHSGVSAVGLASTPSGRLWVFWVTPSSTDRPVIHARRSNQTATGWGAPVTIKPPHGSETAWNLQGSGQAGPLDLVGSFSQTGSSRAASWYTQVLPGLTVSASPKRLHAGTRHAEKVTFTVLDAGRPVKGATVSVHHVSGTTKSNGKVTLALGPFKHRTKLVARATDVGYVAATVRLRVR